MLSIKNKIKLLIGHAKLYINLRPELRRRMLHSSVLIMLSSFAVFCFPRLKPVLKDMMGIYHAEACGLQSLKSVKIMDAISEARLTNQTDSVIFLQIANE